MRSARARDRSRPISELQDDAPSVVRQAQEQGAIEITRYGEPVAFIESPDEHRRHEELDSALERAIWALDIQRALRNAKAGRYSDWDVVAARLRDRFSRR